jgi:hypothetical protein
MNKPLHVEPLPTVVVTLPDAPVPVNNGREKADTPLHHNVPVLDAGFDEIAPGCGDSDSGMNLDQDIPVPGWGHQVNSTGK